MSDIDSLREQALKAREFQIEHGQCTYTLRTPTRQEVRAAVRAERLDVSEAGASMLAVSLLQDALVRRCLVGWTGVRASHVAPVADSAPLPWSPEAVDLWADANPDAADALGLKLLARINERRDRLEADAKN